MSCYSRITQLVPAVSRGPTQDLNDGAAKLAASREHLALFRGRVLHAQDHARSFAGSASDESKYKLYMKANGFDAIMERLANAEERLGAFKESLQDDANQIKVPALLLPFCTPQSTVFPSVRTILGMQSHRGAGMHVPDEKWDVYLQAVCLALLRMVCDSGCLVGYSLVSRVA